MRDPATLRQYPTVVLMWQRGSDTAHIADRLLIPESLAARCVDKYLDTKWRADRSRRQRLMVVADA